MREDRAASSYRCPFPQWVLSILRLPRAAPRVAVWPLYPPSGGAAAHISSMTSSWFDPQSDWEGRDGERVLPLRLVCGWTMNSWVFGSISLLAKVSPSTQQLDRIFGARSRVAARLFTPAHVCWKATKS